MGSVWKFNESNFFLPIFFHSIFTPQFIIKIQITVGRPLIYSYNWFVWFLVFKNVIRIMFSNHLFHEYSLMFYRHHRYHVHIWNVLISERIFQFFNANNKHNSILFIWKIQITESALYWKLWVSYYWIFVEAIDLNYICN